jgi:hypothetical protein
MDEGKFNLENGRDGPQKQHTSTTWTPEAQKEKLTGYMEIIPKFWENIKPGTHVRYYTKKDGFRPGGFVVRNSFNIKIHDSDVEKKCIKLQNGFDSKSPTYSQWVVAYDDIDKIFVQLSASELMMRYVLEEAVDKLNMNDQKIAEHIKQLKIGRL